MSLKVNGIPDPAVLTKYVQDIFSYEAHLSDVSRKLSELHVQTIVVMFCFWVYCAGT